MRIFLFFLVFFQITMAFGTDDRSGALKERIISLYDAGKAEQAVSALNSLAVSSRQDAFVCRLNIAILESERNNRKEAEEALNKAIGIKSSGKSYIFMCRKIISGDSMKVNDQLIRRLENVSDPLEKLLLWQFIDHSLIRISLPELDNFRKALAVLKKYVQGSTIRYAKILSAESSLFYINDDEEQRVSKIIGSNRILDSLHYSRSSVFIRNIRKLFYFSLESENNNYSGYFLKYEKDPYLQQFKEIRTAVNYYKARYFVWNNDLKQSLFFCREAYRIDPEDQNVINYLAFIYRHLKEYKKAILYYGKLKGPTFHFESNIGILRCASESGDTLLAAKMAGLLVREASPENTMLFDLYRIAQNLFYTRQFGYFFKLNRRIMEKYVREDPGNVHLAMIYNFTGIYYWNKGDFRKSLQEFQKALLAVLPDESGKGLFADLNFSRCTSYKSLIEYLNNKGEAFYQLSKQQRNKDEEIKYLKECYKNLNLSIEQMYRYKLRLSSEEQKYLYSGLKSRRYPNIIKVCLELYKLTGDIQYHYKAFEFAEQGRAAIMLSMFRENNAGRIGTVPAKYKAIEDSVNTETSVINQKLKVMKEDNPEVYTLNTRLDVLAERISTLEKLYKKNYPVYYQLKYSTEVTSVPAIQDDLEDDECLIEYLLSRNFLISFYIDKENFLINTDTLKKNNLSQLAESFYQRTSHFTLKNYRPENVKAYAADARTLYNILLKPFEDKFHGKKLIIVTDNDLQKVSFEALLTGTPEDLSGYRNLPYLIRKNAIFYAPSATFLEELRRRPKVTRRSRLLAVSPVYPDLQNNDSIHNIFLAVRADTTFLESLPYANREVLFAHSLAGGKLLSGRNATEARFKKLAGNYDIIHLATHGIVNEESMFDSRLIFARDDSREDGLLYNYEVYNLKQTSQLVILSACNTGNGKSYDGEGVISTGRGFLSSGSRSVIMTLWQVNDLTSFELIQKFYIHLKEKLKISDALRQSKLDFLRQTDNLHSHPVFWSGYIGYGDTSFALKIGYSGMGFVWTAGILIVLAGAFFIRFRKGRFTGNQP